MADLDTLSALIERLRDELDRIDHGEYLYNASLSWSDTEAILAALQAGQEYVEANEAWGRPFGRDIPGLVDATTRVNEAHAALMRAYRKEIPHG